MLQHQRQRRRSGSQVFNSSICGDPWLCLKERRQPQTRKVVRHRLQGEAGEQIANLSPSTMCLHGYRHPFCSSHHHRLAPPHAFRCNPRPSMACCSSAAGIALGLCALQGKCGDRKSGSVWICPTYGTRSFSADSNMRLAEPTLATPRVSVICAGRGQRITTQPRRTGKHWRYLTRCATSASAPPAL